MKHFFKFCIPKILFLLLVANTGIRPATILPTLAAEELSKLGIMCAAAIHEMFVQYKQSDKDENEIFLVNAPEESALTQGAPIQKIAVIKKSDEEVLAKLIQAVTTSTSIKHKLSLVDKNKLYEGLCLQKKQFLNTLADNRSVGWAEQKFNAVHNTTIRSMKIANGEQAQIRENQKVDAFLLKNYEARLPQNLPNFQKEVKTILGILVNYNIPDPADRIEARIQLSYLAEGDQNLFGDLKKRISSFGAAFTANIVTGIVEVPFSARISCLTLSHVIGVL